jgi:S-DNA-T family DNA segregation ATPase FtsK/SpoIIIE
VKAPAVQQDANRETWSPELNLKPSEKSPHTPEESEWIPRQYNFPPITDLAMPRPAVGDTGAEDAMRSRKLEETLASFRVQAQVVHVTHGPAVSRFELELAPGTKVNKVAELEKDIAYGMEATSVRIEAPIPGKSLVGVEVPNRQIETVTLREVLSSERMQNAKSILTVALGKDLTGTPIICDLAKMPHMLIAGQTGSGKSVCINAIINSLLYRASPDEVKLILVDPKVVELQCYNGIPHLLIPVVNDPHKAAAALAWAVAEMKERYDKFAERRVRNVDGYNASLKSGEKPMARIVIIIDELADLMMVCKKDVEEYICRLTQLARAAGIHLIVATQRPSVDVITGLIKANIPSRIAFKTAQSVDSRTILDRNGSEQLLGWGDMLYLPTGAFAPTRVQGCFLSDEEVNRIVKHVRDANPSTYDPDILEKMEEMASGSSNEGTGADMIAGEMGGGDGGLFEQAVEYAIADGQISTSTLQRRLKIGYARAGRLTDEMEERGIVAAKDGSKPRKCLITREEWEEMKKNAEDLV